MSTNAVIFALGMFAILLVLAAFAAYMFFFYKKHPEEFKKLVEQTIADRPKSIITKHGVVTWQYAKDAGLTPPNEATVTSKIQEIVEAHPGVDLNPIAKTLQIEILSSDLTMPRDAPAPPQDSGNIFWIRS